MPSTLPNAPPTVAPPSVDDPPLAPITVPTYTAILRSGALEGQRVYLWNGRLAPRMTTGRPHTICVTRTYNALYDLRIHGVFVEQEQPMAFRLTHTAPYPDVKLVRGRPQDFPSDLPTTADVPLVIEVAESGLAEARRRVSSYAQEEIPVYWIINLIDRAIEVYERVSHDAYGPPTLFREADEVPVVVDGTEVGRLRVADLLP